VFRLGALLTLTVAAIFHRSRTSGDGKSVIADVYQFATMGMSYFAIKEQVRIAKN
jgi:hypothetical protein